jgi:phosphate transport system protein
MNQTQTKHVTHGYDRQLDTLMQTLHEMTAEVIQQVELSLKALHETSIDHVKEAKQRDRAINTLEEKVENQVTTIITSQMPMAQDLRAVLSSLRIAAELERAGDHAKNIVKRCAKLGGEIPSDALAKFETMGRDVLTIIKRAMEAFTAGNTEGAIEVWKSDDEIDNLYREIFKLIQKRLQSEPDAAERWTHITFIAKFYERIADYANEIAKTVHYVQTGNRPRHKSE